MKNKFLLLGATALLSTGLAAPINAKLSGLSDSKELQVQAEIVKDLNLEVKQHLNFGRISFDPARENSGSVQLEPDSNGDFTASYHDVKFHDGGQMAKICFTDLIPTAGINNGLSILVGAIELYDADSNLIGDIDFAEPHADAGATNGVRCYYIGADITLYTSDKAKAFSGNISKTTTVTVTYASFY